ncbi:hypothetical protein BLA14095_03717 [Burkholderia lata]|uniref:hypothetical protein n=1 Tax=Burkholderia lata (strain ATCC 17760 / DSM 23089 / LMG 22485 / NCIMB 9086 / R18194 / 383) TaxID=482957 RepID=UPI00145485C2|nr:hypothetical protein [Burkholderia lata]VWB80514.1 hypothetical protein BLA14095_03717 [Burkholderia lata]
MAEKMISWHDAASSMYDASNALFHAESLLELVRHVIEVGPIDSDHALALIATGIDYIHAQGVEAGETADDFLAQSR